ncbi:CobW family GTP-binding protein [Phreatobacter stygius]|uniref:GTP-binding protein n=1 Tax=Phreatobacter stygius TaxID=1940610 RepID=A0A4D7AVB7_9HYPH|nr:GTP-binding protein [Phreatobacter stygius]QCI62928.1 GTP-binding protein [Phreatobacter stygius]
MAIPVILVTGFLGAGKTTLINHLLSAADGRRLAAVVNDFGAINIDADLIAGAADGVVSLANGCICCSLQGDLLRTLGRLMRRDPPPDGIIIETSGVSDPAEIVTSLLDPVIWREAALEAVIALADARALTDKPDLLDDALCRAQIAAADIVALNKADLVTPDELVRARALLAALRPARVIFDVTEGRIAPELAFAGEPQAPREPGQAGRAHGFSTPRFETMSWTADAPLSLPRFQAAIGKLSPHLVRAKGFVAFREQAGRPLLFQLVGERATLGPAPAGRDGAPLVRLVLIAENGKLDADATRAMLEACIEREV